MSSPTTNSNFIRLLPAETNVRSEKASPPTNKTSEHRCASCMQREAASPEPHDHEQAQNGLSHGAVDHKKYDMPSLNVNALFSQSSQYPTAKMGGEAHSVMESGERLVPGHWSVPHAPENQKHAWYSSMLGIEAKVKDEWGFSSASASRSHTPNKIF